MSKDVNEDRRKLPRAMEVKTECWPRDDAEHEFQLPTSSEPDVNTYRRAARDAALRTIFALTILAAGSWLPESYLDQISWYWMDPDPVVWLASFVSKAAACIYGAMALWSFHFLFDAWWIVRNRDQHQNT